MFGYIPPSINMINSPNSYQGLPSNLKNFVTQEAGEEEEVEMEEEGDITGFEDGESEGAVSEESAGESITGF